MRVPSTDTISATTRALTAVRFGLVTPGIIKRPYGFVKCGRAESLRRPQGAPPRPDPGGRAAGVRPPRLRGDDGRGARGGHGPLPGRDLQLLPEQAGDLPGARGRVEPAVDRDLARARLPRPARGDRARGSRLARRPAGGSAAGSHRPGLPGARREGARRSCDEHKQERLDRFAAQGVRDDVPLETAAVFLSLVANGLALRRTMGDPMPDLDALAELVERGVAPRRSRKRPQSGSHDPPYSSYAAIAATFLGGLTLAAALARALGRDAARPERARPRDARRRDVQGVAHDLARPGRDVPAGAVRRG